MLGLVIGKFGGGIVKGTRGQFHAPLGQFFGPCDAFASKQPHHLDEQQRAVGESRWELEVVVRRSGNSLADVPYSALFSETVCVVMRTIVSFVLCLAALSVNALL